MAKSTRTYVQLVLLGLLLVVAPIGSYLYLKWGYDYRVESLDELSDYGNLRAESGYATPTRRTIDVLYTAPSSPDDSVGVAIAQLYEAFKDQPDVRFRSLGSRDALTPPGARQTDGGDIDVKRANAAFARLSQADPNCERVPIAQRAVLVDTLGTLRRCYDLHAGQEVNRIVEQINILIPRKRGEDIFVSEAKEY